MSPQPIRLLLLDPNFVTRIALTSRLEATGYMVRAEKVVSTAARAATASNWDLIVASASLAKGDLEAFLETLTMTESTAIVCVVVDGTDRERVEIAGRYKAHHLAHPVRPQTLGELCSPPPRAEQATEPFFRTA
ncbi:MAG: hypothetical protein HUU15_03400 [Candidatus Brocadiae bacterium]|nr:hypothetical protein [Candidatus Brocadiia bacterium]